MEEESSSWIRRTKFSHTICHRLDSSRLASFSIPEKDFNLKSRSVVGNGRSFVDQSQKSVSFVYNNKVSSSANNSGPIQKTMNKQRSLSPLPQTALSDTFKEAKSDRKRFSTPLPRRRESKDQEKGFMGHFFHSDNNKSSKRLSNSNTSPLRHFQEKLKSKKDHAWTKYFDHNGGKVNAVEAADEFSVDMSELYLGHRFAHGANSRLYHGKYKDEPVAVKIMRPPDDAEKGKEALKVKNQYDAEVTLLSRLHHPNVLKFVAACKTPPVYCVITEYLSEGSLRSYLHKLESERKSLPLEKIISIALDIARGMEYIHSQGVIHRDLKPENVLIDEEFHMKIADFGIACEEACCGALGDDDDGSYRWMAPEMIKKKAYGRRVDVYSFGLILWEMVAGTVPYDDMIPIQAAFAVASKNLRPVIPRECPPVMKALIQQCWSVQPDKRPEFRQIVKVLERFEVSLAKDGNLNSVLSKSQDHKKGLLLLMQKLDPVHPSSSSKAKSTPMPKPKFT